MPPDPSAYRLSTVWNPLPCASLNGSVKDVSRCSRYGSATANAVTPAATTPTTSAKYRMGMPTIHSSPSRISR